MGDGLKRVAKNCGGLIVNDPDGNVTRYDAQGRLYVRGSKLRHMMDKPSTPLWNLASYSTELLACMDIVMRARHASGLSSVAFHKERLGKQDFCWTSSKRLYVWEYIAADGTFLGRVFASKEGTSPEAATVQGVPWPSFTLERGRQFMRVYMTALGLEYPDA